MSTQHPIPVGRFQLFKSVKKGGMARVFLGVDPQQPEALFAVKTLLPDLARDRLYREMFVSEGKVGVRLVHPHIVRTVEFGEHDNTPFIAMEYIAGFDLSTVLRALRKSGESMPPALAVALIRDVCRGLAHAHELADEQGRPLSIVNRDVSPGNIMVGFDGCVRLIDFGIAQTTIDVRSQIGSIKGKISYMAPEQVRGLPVDHRVDLFSTGVVLYELLTGVRVFAGDGDFDTMERVRRAEAPPASTHQPAVDPALDALLAQAMAREPSARHSTARALAEALDGWLKARGEAPDDGVTAAWLDSLLGPRIAALRAEITGGRAAALGQPEPTPPAGQPVGGPRRLISEDTLAEMAALVRPERPPEETASDTPPPRPDPPATHASRSAAMWALGAFALVILGALIWWAGR